MQVIIKSISGESAASTYAENKKGAGRNSSKNSKIDQEMERKLRLALGRARKTCRDQICGGKVSLTSIFPETEIYTQARALCDWYKNNGDQIDAGQYVQNIVSDGYRYPRRLHPGFDLTSEINKLVSTLAWFADLEAQDSLSLFWKQLVLFGMELSSKKSQKMMRIISESI